MLGEPIFWKSALPYIWEYRVPIFYHRLAEVMLYNTVETNQKDGCPFMVPVLVDEASIVAISKQWLVSRLILDS